MTKHFLTTANGRKRAVQGRKQVVQGSKRAVQGSKRGVRRWVTLMRWYLRRLTRGELRANGGRDADRELPPMCYNLD